MAREERIAFNASSVIVILVLPLAIAITSL